MIGPTLIALRGLESRDRRLLSHFCLVEASSGRRDRESCRTLQALSEACDSIDGSAAPADGGTDVGYLRRLLAELSVERLLALAQATSRWLDSASVDHLLELVDRLKETLQTPGNGHSSSAPGSARPDG